MDVNGCINAFCDVSVLTVIQSVCFACFAEEYAGVLREIDAAALAPRGVGEDAWSVAAVVFHVNCVFSWLPNKMWENALV